MLLLLKSTLLFMLTNIQSLWNTITCMYKQSYKPRSIQMIYKFRNIILKSYLLSTNTTDNHFANQFRPRKEMRSLIVVAYFLTGPSEVVDDP